MSPSHNTIVSALVVWRDAKRRGTSEGWQRCANQFGGMQTLLSGWLPDDHSYIKDMVLEAIDMMEETQ